jgi:hypothetical protein
MNEVQQHPPLDSGVPIKHKSAGSRKDALCVLALVALVVVSWVPRFSGPIDLRWDGSVYYVLGTSLAEGKGYRLLNEPGEIRAIQYPPLLPLIIAVHQMILGTSDPVAVGMWLRRSWFVLSVVYIVCTYLLGRLFLPRGYAFLLSLFCLASYEMYFLSTLLFTELPFAFTTTLFAVLYYKQRELPATRFLTPVVGIASYLLRTMGIALLAAWVLDAFMGKQFRRAAIRAGIAAIPILVWHSYVHAVESGYEYKHPAYVYQRDPSIFVNVSYATNISLKSPFRPSLGKATTQDLVNRFVNNLRTVPSSLGQAISSIRALWQHHFRGLNRRLRPLAIPEWIIDISLNLVGWIVLAGMVCLWRGEARLIGIYLSLAIAMVCATPWSGQILRYLAAILPFVGLAFLTCMVRIQELSRFRFRGKGRLFASAVSLVIPLLILSETLASLRTGIRDFRQPAIYENHAGIQSNYWLFHYPHPFPSVEAGLKWLAGHADHQAIVAVSMPQWVYLKTGLRTVMPPLESDPLKAQQLIDSVPASYLILDRMIMEGSFNNIFPALVRNSPEKWSCVYSSGNGDVEIYRRVNSGTS